MGTWKQQYRQAVHEQASMLCLLRNGVAAVLSSGNATLRSSIAAERFVAPCVLCMALDACGVPAPTDVASPITGDTQARASLSGSA